jgi:uncharacterized protein (DUF488 family)
VPICEPGTVTGDRTIRTIGHSILEAEQFLALLANAGVALLVDVRRHPGSRRVPWTNSGELERLLGEAGIGYLHLPALGGRRRPASDSPNGGWQNAQFQGYADHMSSEDFREGLVTLEAEAARRPAAVMCAEAQWWRCHRRLLADALLVRGWRVGHLDSRGGSQAHELTEFAIVDGEALRYPAGGQLALG